VFKPFEHQQLTRYDRISTTVFSDHPESMKYRGTWKVHSREELDGPAGRFKISYVSDVRADTLAECYAWWWKRDGAKQVAEARRRAAPGRSAGVEAA
jgi:hypothetical protein